MITKGNNGNITLSGINNITDTTQQHKTSGQHDWHNMTTLDLWPCTRLSYPWGTTLHTLYFTITFKHAPISGQGRSWHLTNLPYTMFKELVITSIWLIRNHFIAAKNTQISDILLVLHVLFLGTPPCTDIIASFWLTLVRTQDVYRWYDLQYCCF